MQLGFRLAAMKDESKRMVCIFDNSWRMLQNLRSQRWLQDSLNAEAYINELIKVIG